MYRILVTELKGGNDPFSELWHRLSSIDETELQEKRKIKLHLYDVCKVLFSHSDTCAFLQQFHVFEASKDYWSIILSHICSD